MFFIIPKAYAQTSIDISPPEGIAVDPNVVSVNDFIRFIINILVVVGVLASLIFLIYGGIRWILSGGDKQAVESARGHVIAAIIGLLIIVLAWVILNIVLALAGLGGLDTILELPTLTNPTLQADKALP